uniref:CCR4-NOT transcription complex subunit 4 n=1 Tax=Compsopogon caeruleus TaxID=31354 RepID=A0A7S1TG26_9RHOD|mmetsp:Transcript_4981/g.10051  ORF Transcript_4981/g.10051 Transcript_4981/m.10051 type:complete len:491 (+) Transcript_4981:127-1599(+)|eukprot:CAMPEP_0184679216 /NCGR_PEP_ID=MMETSP0312-20130426/2036_1 /TAXON_ID=31354 /ORGANISM="Compsopogon coeruleus, Strain SAG 36.94" /LENGTH=490 /DNA_ID=CAMNT_0027128513 /DNA_START=62 /DNA_END=1534 /DNA_ORIENTATION=-
MNLGSDEDEAPSCPLCLEELDATDLSMRACQCGYQVCLWCLHHIREQLNGRCPACRTPYEEEKFVYDEVDPEEAARVARQRAEAKRERERKEKQKELERQRAMAQAASQQKAKLNLKMARIVQKNLVYAIGLSLTLAREEVLRRPELFGRFGKINLVFVNRNHPYNSDAPGGPSISAYIQFSREADAAMAARHMNGEVLDGREIRTAIATTKYCDAYGSSGCPAHCGNPRCLYLHDAAHPDDVLTREEVLSRGLGPPPPPHLFQDHPRDGSDGVRKAGSPPTEPSAGPTTVHSSSSVANPLHVGENIVENPLTRPAQAPTIRADQPLGAGNPRWVASSSTSSQEPVRTKSEGGRSRPPGFDSLSVARPPGFLRSESANSSTDGEFSTPHSAMPHDYSTTTVSDAWADPLGTNSRSGSSIGGAEVKTKTRDEPLRSSEDEVAEGEDKEAVQVALQKLAVVLANLGESLGLVSRSHRSPRPDSRMDFAQAAE